MAQSSSRRASFWIAVFALVGIALVLLYHDAEQQDSGYHYLFARWAWQHPTYFVGVWARPLFTFLYSIPAQFGYPAAKFFTVLISLATGWQTFRLAQKLNFERTELSVPFLFLQPSFFALISVVLTETLFALLFVIGLRFHISGKIRTGILIASLLILVRPEGFFVAVLWGLWVLFDRRDRRSRWRRMPEISILSSGMILWWLAAYSITGDALWIVHDWPSEWQADGKANGTGPIWWYFALLPLIVGPLLIVPFIYGLAGLLRQREFIYGTSSFLVLFILHSLMYMEGWFGSAGYPRYLVCISPAIAIITLAGWNRLVERARSTVSKTVTAGVIAASTVFCLLYYDGWQYTRDAVAIEEMHGWFRSNEKPVSRLICSQSYMRILFNRDLREAPNFSRDRDYNLNLIRQSPSGTLVFWDEDTGPKWFQMRAEDFELAGYVPLRSQSFNLGGLFFTLSRRGYGGARLQQMHLFYKEMENARFAPNQYLER